MTNTYFDEARGSEYRGGFRICRGCTTVVPSAYWDRHASRCAEIEDLLENPAGIHVEDLADEGETTPADPKVATEHAGGL